MIRINLIPEEERKKVKRARIKKPVIRIPGIDLIISILVLLGLGAALFFFNRAAEKSLSTLENNIKTSQEELRKLQKERQIVENIEKRQQELKRWISLVQDLNKGRSLQVHVMGEINKLKPDYMWFTSYEETSGNFKLNGSTFSNLIISNFMVRLKESPYFTDIRLEEVNEKTEKEHSILVFTLTGKVLTNTGG